MKTDTKNLKSSTLILSFILRFAVFTAGWFILMGGQKISDIGFVILFVSITTLISMYSIPPGQWVLSPLGVVRFIPYFLITAMLGGWDVARRVFYRNIPIDPDFVTINHDKDPRKTLILTWVISLLPGTASTVITQETIIVHVLDKKLPVTEEIQVLKNRINGMFGG